MNKNSLKEIIFDLLNIIRGARPTDDEPISERQLESWIHDYRATLLKRDLDKGKLPNPDYIQTIDNLALTYDSGSGRYRTEELPSSIDLNYNSGITFVGDSAGYQIQLLPEKRVLWHEYNKWTQDDTLAYLRNNRIYLYNPKGLTSIYIRGIFENPIDAVESNGNIYSDDDAYPMPRNLIPVLKTEILSNELGIEWRAPSDTINNTNHEIAES